MLEVMMGAFITGSQTEAHKFRMLKEAIKFLLRITLFSIILSLAITIYKIPSYDLKVWFYYYKADSLKSLLKPESSIEVTNSKGEALKAPVKYILSNSQILDLKNSIEDKLLKAIRNALLIPFLIPLWFWYQGKKRSKNTTIRGTEKVSFLILSKLVKKYNDKILERGFWSILTIIRKLNAQLFKTEFKKIEYLPYSIAPNIEYPAFTEHQHTFITGGSGTGKTVLLSSILDQIKKRGETAIIYDKMGSFIPYFYDKEKDIILNPFDKRSKNWSIFNEVRAGKEEMDLRNIASGLIPNNKNGDNFWNEQARNLFIEIAKELIRSGKANNKNLADYILKKGFVVLKEFLKNSDVKSLFENDEQMRTTLSIRSTLTAYTTFLKTLIENKEKEEFSIREFINSACEENKGKFLFLTSRSDMHESLQPLLTCQMDIAINSLLSGKQQKGKNIWITLDELPSINQIPTLDAGLAQSRQFGGSFVLSMQLIWQLRETYGEKKADTISGNCKTRVVFSSPDVNTSKWASETLGKKEVNEIKEGLTFGANEIRDGVSLSSHRKLEDLVIPSEIQSLPNLSFYLRLPFSFPITNITIKPKDRKKITESFIEAEYLPIEKEKKKKDNNEENDDIQIWDNKVKSSPYALKGKTTQNKKKLPAKLKKNIFEEE